MQLKNKSILRKSTLEEKYSAVYTVHPRKVTVAIRHYIFQPKEI